LISGASFDGSNCFLWGVFKGGKEAFLSASGLRPDVEKEFSRGSEAKPQVLPKVLPKAPRFMPEGTEAKEP